MKKNFFLLLIVSVALFFYTYNLHYTYFFSGDSARDTLASLRILKNKEITAIGPPLSFGQYGVREVYFGSLTYYMGALGLFFTKNNVLGPVCINIFLMIFGIIFFYKLAKIILKNEEKTLISTFLYALSPVIVAHLRFFWNPNFIISLGPIFWYFLVKSFSDKKIVNLLIAGFLGGVLFNFHYFVFPVVFLSSFLIIKKNKNFKQFFIFWLGFLISISPLIFFELKNKFYLTNALIFNFTDNSKFGTTFNPILQRTLVTKLLDVFRIPLIILALENEVTFFPTTLNISNYYLKTIIGLVIFVLLFYNFRKRSKNNFWIVFLIIFSAFFTTLLSHEEFYLRYFFITLPLLLIIFSYIINKILLIILIICFLNLNWQTTKSIYYQKDLLNRKKTIFPLIKHLEKAYQIIKNEKIKKPYNITENFSGDARALYLRFFLEADYQLTQPETFENYSNLNTLFVFAPNLNTVFKEGRWEFVATPKLKLTKTYKIDEGKYLFKFEKNN